MTLWLFCRTNLKKDEVTQVCCMNIGVRKTRVLEMDSSDSESDNETTCPPEQNEDELVDNNEEKSDTETPTWKDLVRIIFFFRNFFF